MINGFKVITLCGSTRFKDEYMEVQKRLTLEGNIVISVGLFGHSGDEEVWNEGVKEMLDRQHLAKIDLADEIFVINVGGYIGESTRREIAYEKSKGKAVVYLEDIIKPGIYGYFSVLDKFHELGRLSDEEYKKAIDENEKKVFLAAEEYNACKGPWPYHWKNIDPVVCGILQKHSIMSIDYNDLKLLYEYDSAYEVRIKGKGNNVEERIQSIMETVKSNYMNQLISSKRVVITLFSPLNYVDISHETVKPLKVFLEELENNDVDYVLQLLAPSEDRELVLSIVYMSNRKEMYKKWVDKACVFVDKVGPTLKLPVGAMQSDICQPLALGHDINIMFLGHDAHEVPKPDFKFVNSDYFRDRCIYGNENWGARNEEWPIWKNLRNIFLKVIGDSSLMDDTEHMVFTNAVFFTGDKIHEVLEQIGTTVESKCMELTRELVFEILQPKLLVCFSVGDVFDKLVDSIKKKEDTNVKLTVKKFKPYHIKHYCAITQFNKTIILGIPHPSGAYGVLASLPAIVRIINDLSKGMEIEKVVATKDLFLDPQDMNKYMTPKMDKAKIVQQVISSFNLIPYEEKNNRFRINEIYGITITGSKEGYIGIRHILYDYKSYENEQDEDVLALKRILKEREYKTTEKAWIGTKLFSQFGQTDEEIINNILDEIEALKNVCKI